METSTAQVQAKQSCDMFQCAVQRQFISTYLNPKKSKNCLENCAVFFSFCVALTCPLHRLYGLQNKLFLLLKICATVRLLPWVSCYYYSNLSPWNVCPVQTAILTVWPLKLVPLTTNFCIKICTYVNCNYYCTTCLGMHAMYSKILPWIVLYCCTDCLEKCAIYWNSSLLLSLGIHTRVSSLLSLSSSL